MVAFGAASFMPSAAVAQEITFADILAAPDDIQLNLDYARQEVAGGRLQQAAAALERLLLLKPNWDEARLFYGIVLYRLDDLNGAIRELTLLEDRGLGPTQEQQRGTYLALAQKQSSPVRLSARYTLGMRIDGNPSRSPKDATLILPTATNEGSDVGVTGSSQFRAEVDLGGSNGNYLFFQGNSYINHFFNVDSADLLASRAKAGVVLHGPDVLITPYVLYGSSWLQYEKFRQQYGGGIDSSWTLSSQVDFILNGRAVYQDYQTTSYSAIGDQRDGWRKSIEAGFKFRATDRQSFRVTGRFARKDAEFDGYSYDESRIAAKSLTLFGDGRFLSLSASYTQTTYDQADGMLSATIPREDKLFYTRAAIGAPLATIFGSADIELPDSIADVVFQVGTSYTRQQSSISRLNHNNWSADILFTKRISF
ncbi:MAG: surface lipoprotein assembly modifier [Rhizobiaceae bacterium]